MGFGLLFVGYVFTYLIGFTKYTAGAILIGCCLMYSGLSRLRNYNPTFKRAIYIIIPIFFAKLYLCGGLIDEIFELNIPFFRGTVSIVLNVIEQVLDLAFHFALYTAVKSITSDLDLYKLNNSALRNIILTFMYYIPALLWMLPITLADTVKTGFGYLLIILRLFISVLNSILIYSCYMHICPVGDEDMPIKKSRFAFINKLREETARRQQKVADERVERYLRFRDKMSRKRSKNNKKKNGK